MNTNVIASFKLMGMGMAAIFLVIIVIYFAVNLPIKNQLIRGRGTHLYWRDNLCGKVNRGMSPSCKGDTPLLNG